MKSYIWLLFLPLVLVSCKDGEKKTTGEEIEKRKQQKLDSIVDSKFNEINKQEVDTYPLFKEICSDTLSKEQQRQCFETSFGKFFQERLQKEGFEVVEPVNDTVLVHIKVDNKGKIVLEKIEASDKIKELLATPEQSFEDIVKDNLEEVTAVYPVVPATKQGVNVNTQFMVPIVVKVK